MSQISGSKILIKLRQYQGFSKIQYSTQITSKYELKCCTKAQFKSGDSFFHSQQKISSLTDRFLLSKSPARCFSSGAGSDLGKSNLDEAKNINVDSKLPTFEESLAILTGKPIPTSPESGENLEKNLPSLDESLASLGAKPNQDEIAGIENSAIDTMSTGFSTFEPSFYNPVDHAVNLVQFIHESTGSTYAATIFGTTIAIRCVMFPLMVISQKNTSRMAHMKPEMEQIQSRLNKATSQAEKMKYTSQIKALFTKYDCKISYSFIPVLVQAPVFMSFFFAMQKMPKYFPDLTTGGYLWFSDLTIPDTTYGLPIMTALTFLATLEINKDMTLASNPQNGMLMINAFRGMAVAMVPLMSYLPGIVFCYFGANNLFTAVQMGVLKQPAVRNMFGIWEAPKPIPGREPKGFTKYLKDEWDKKKKEKEEQLLKDKITRHNQRVVERKGKFKKNS